MRLYRFSCLLIALSFTLTLVQAQVHFQDQAIFENGTAAYACYRIPAIIKAPNGDLLAFVEGRADNCHDFGNVDIVLKVSNDNGATWSKQRIVVDNDSLQAGNPAPVVDYSDPDFPQGRIFLLYNTGTASEYEVRNGNGIREVHYMTSTDNGATWSRPVNITHQVHRPNQPAYHPDYRHPEDWRSYALTPGHGIQLSGGRIFIPANHSAGPPQDGFNEYRSHAIYSDDHGKSWQLSDNVDVPSANEATAAELANGKVMMNIRQQNGKKRQRLIAISEDKGESWSKVYFDSSLVGPVCQASLLAYQTPNRKSALLFSNPAHPNQRVNLTLRLSLDDGNTWPIARSIYKGDAAYSDLVIEKSGQIGVLYERGNNGGIHYADFNFAWLKKKE